jgi:hypothetical protein
MTRLLADDDRASERLEARDQADVLLRTLDFVPFEPKAVRVPHIRLAKVLLYLVRRKDVLPGRPVVGWVAIGLVKRIDDELPLDLDRFLLAVRVEVQASAETPLRRLAGLVERRLFPVAQHSVGQLRLFLIPRHRLGEVGLAELCERLATPREAARDEHRAEERVGPVVECRVHGRILAFDQGKGGEWERGRLLPAPLVSSIPPFPFSPYPIT